MKIVVAWNGDGIQCANVIVDKKILDRIQHLEQKTLAYNFFLFCWSKYRYLYCVIKDTIYLSLARNTSNHNMTQCSLRFGSGCLFFLFARFVCASFGFACRINTYEQRRTLKKIRKFNNKTNDANRSIK